MTTTKTPRTPTVDPMAADATEHRTVTVIFADLVNSTSHMEALGPEDYAEVLRIFHSECNDAVRGQGGVVAQYQGDGIICYFGYPSGGENDAARAVTAALDMVSRLASRTDVAGGALQTRIGLSTGVAMIDVAADQFGSSAVGSCINKAARLEALAEPGQVLVCEDTRRLIGDLFHCRDHGPQELKGFREAQSVFRVERPRGGMQSRFEALRGRRHSPLIGRDGELDALRGHFEAAGGGRARAVVLTAEPGLGKSRLVAALRADPALDGAAIFALQCAPEQQGSALYPLRSYLEWVAGAGPSDDPETRHAKIDRLITNIWRISGADHAVLLDLLSPLGADVEIDMSDSVPLRRQRAFALLARMVFRSLPAQRPALLIVEDAHWIDPSSADFLQALMVEAAERPLMLLVTTRNEPPFGDGMPGAVDLIRLAPLRVEDAMALARASFADSAPSEEALRTIIEKSEGVPLFVEEYADVVQSAGAEALSRSQVPLTLGGLVQGKLDRLNGETQVFARTASVVGRLFEPRLIGALTGLEGERIAAAVQGLMSQNLVQATGPGGGEDQLGFSHALIRDAIYSGMNRGQRRGMHERVAEHYLAQGGDMVVGEHVLADHLARSGRHKEAIERFLNAALEAAGAGAAGEAFAHLETAMTCIAELPAGEERDLLELRIASIKGPTQMVTRGPGNPDFGETQARAMDLLERLGLQTQMVPVIYNTALHAWATADLDRAMNIAKSIAMINQQSPDDAAAMAASTMRGLIAWHQGRNDMAEAGLSATVALHKPEVHRDLYSVFLKEFGVFSLFYLGLTKTVQGHVQEGAAFADRAYDLGREMGFPHARGFGMLARFNTAMLRGDVDTADKASAEALEFSTRQGFPEFMAMSRYAQGWVATQRGDLAGGAAAMAAGLEIWAATGFSCWQALFAAFTAEAHVAAGDLTAAEALLDTYEPIVRRTGEFQTLAPLRCARAVLLRAQGQDSAAAEMAMRAREAAEEQSALLWRDRVDARFPR